MVPSLRSRFVAELLPSIRAGIRPLHLRPCYADDALQESLVALLPHLDRLSAMPEAERFAYVFVVASRIATAVRRNVGLEAARASDQEVRKWELDVVRRAATPEDLLRAAEGAARVDDALAAMSTTDRKVVLAVNGDGLSERDAARELSMTRGQVDYRIRRARELLARAWLGTTSWAGRQRRG